MVDLVCHPLTPTDAVRSLAVRIGRSADGLLVLAFRLDGDLSSIDVPAPRVPRLAHQLWEHTCFEAFIAREDSAAYHELNFSNSRRRSFSNAWSPHMHR
jgi:hypothetical protein